jgi:hypothetical protein
MSVLPRLILVSASFIVLLNISIEAAMSFEVTERKMSASVKFNRGYELNVDISRLQFFNGWLYGIDYQNQSIIKIDTLKATLQNIGRHGSMSGEFRQLLSFSLNEEGISAFDIGSNTVTEFTLQGTYLRQFKYKKGISRAIRATKNVYLLKINDPGSATKEKFEVWNVATNKTKEIFAYRTSTNTDDARDLITDGDFIFNGHDRVIRVSSRAGEFLVFNKEGDPKYIARTIDGTVAQPPLKHTYSDGSRSMGFSKSARIVNLSASSDKQYLYILSNAASPFIKDKSDGVTDDRVIDIYSLKDGKYVSSVMLPKYKDSLGKELRATSIAIADSKLFVVHGGNCIVHYSLKM